jgi:succinate-acetate transporter protein
MSNSKEYRMANVVVEETGVRAATDVAATPGPLAIVADPAPLGLAGFAMTTVLFSALNAGLIKSGGLTFVGMALAYGGLAQLLAGMWEFRNRNTFGATAFSSFGAFWIGLGALFVFDVVGRPVGGAMFGGDGAIWFLFCWAVFTAYMFVASLRVSGAVMAVFLLLTLTFVAAWIGALNGSAAGNGFTGLAGYLGLLTGIVAFYTSFALVTNSTFGRTVLPVYPMNRPISTNT